MSLTRNSYARNINFRRKKKSHKKTQHKLDSIMKKHGIFELPLCDCKIIKHDGTIMNIEFEKIRGNLRSGVFIIAVKAINQIENVVYDLIEMENRKKNNEDNPKSGICPVGTCELSRDTTTDQEDNSSSEKVQEPEKHNIFTQIEENTERISKTIPSMSDNYGVFNQTDIEKNVNHFAGRKKNKDKRKKEKKKNNIRQMQNALNNKLSRIEKGNKYLRKTLRDIRANYKLEKWDYKYFEVKVETSYMVIENVQIYYIFSSTNTGTIFLLLVGDLQMKNGIIRRLDPMYQTEQILGEHNSFYEKIIGKEDTKMSDSSRNTTDGEMEVTTEEKGLMS
jgi:hypothetical protein